MGDIFATIDIWWVNTPVANSEAKKILILADLSLIAKYFNKDWKKTNDNQGYIFMKSYVTGVINVEGIISILPRKIQILKPMPYSLHMVRIA